jgi:protein-tyrosine kinase
MSLIFEGLQNVGIERPGDDGTPVRERTAASSRQPQPDLSFASLFAHCSQKTWSPDLKRMLFSGNGTHKAGVEEFRTLRANLYAIRERVPLRSILVTSALPGEGKSLVACNLAQVLVRQTGKRCLLIDADLRKPELHEFFGTSGKPGLSDYLTGKTDLYDAIQRDHQGNLFLLPAGRQTADAAELLAGRDLNLLIEGVKPCFDWIVVDSPPALCVSDATVVSASCDGVLLVLEAFKTPLPLAVKARRLFSGKAIVGAVLNRTRNRPGDMYSYPYVKQQ